MSLIDKGESILAWVKTAAVLLLVGGLLVAGWYALGQRRGRLSAEDALEKAQEAAEIDRAGLLRSHEVSAAALQAKLDEARASSAGFAAALSKAQQQLRDAKVVSVLTASTGPQPVQPATGAAPQPGAAPACALLEGDQGEIEVRQATLETQVGNRVVIGEAEAFRVSPRRLLFSGAFAVPLTEATEIASPAERAPGWGAGPLAGISTAGGQLGVVVATPEGRMPLLGGKVFGVASGVGGSGQFAISAGLVWRP